MALFDFLRRQPPAPEECLYAVPLAARKLTDTGAVPKIYIYYAFLFANSADVAVARLYREVRNEGFEILQLTGPVLDTSIADWPAFVARKFDWMKESLPTAAEITAAPRTRVFYSPKIVQS